MYHYIEVKQDKPREEKEPTRRHNSHSFIGIHTSPHHGTVTTQSRHHTTMGPPRTRADVFLTVYSCLQTH